MKVTLSALFGMVMEYLFKLMVYGMRVNSVTIFSVVMVFKPGQHLKKMEKFSTVESMKVSLLLIVDTVEAFLFWAMETSTLVCLNEVIIMVPAHYGVQLVSFKAIGSVGNHQGK